MSDKAPYRRFLSFIVSALYDLASRNLATLHGIAHVGDHSAQTPKVWPLRYYLRAVGRWLWKIGATVPLRSTW